MESLLLKGAVVLTRVRARMSTLIHSRATALLIRTNGKEGLVQTLIVATCFHSLSTHKGTQYNI